MSVATGTGTRAPVRERRPGGRKPLLRRERPLAHLHEAIGNGLIVIQAPAGSGKTALAMQFADELDFSVAWVALDAGCASPEVFAERLARVLAGQTPRDAKMAILDVRRRRLHCPSDIPELDVILDGEVAAFTALWSAAA